MSPSQPDADALAAKWTRIKVLVGHALEQPTGQRSAFLAEACRGDEGLRREVESLIASDAAAQSFCERPAAELLAHDLEQIGRDSPRLSAGTVLGNYEILQFIGAGGMGEVYRARDVRLRRDVAVKILHAQLADRTGHARLLREARHASRLGHPNICRVYEVGEADGTPFIVMEYVDGRPLADIVSAGPLAARRALALAAQVASALDHAHERGIVHRDLKSSNVVVTPDDRAIVLDFGLSRRLPDTSPETSELTAEAPGGPAGTLSYMAPEVLSGASADARSDVWALGVLLFEMLTGALPFTGRTAFEVSSAILNDAPRELPRGAGAALRWIVRRCLEKDPSVRYGNAGEVHAALQDASDGRGLVRTIVRAHRPRLSHAAAVLALLAGILALAGGGLRWLTAYGVNGVSTTLALLPLENATQDPANDFYVDGVTDGLIAELGALPDLRVISRGSVMRYRGANRPVAEIARELRATAVVQGELNRQGDRVTLQLRLVNVGSAATVWSQRYEASSRDVLVLQADAVRGLADAVQLALAADARERLTVVRAVDAGAYEAYLKGRYHWNQRTENSLQVAVQHFARAIELDPTYAPAHAALADCYNQLATVFVGTGSPHEYRPRAAAAAIKALQIDPRSAEARATLGYVKHYDLEWEESERQFRRAIELNPSYPLARVWYANMLMARRRFDEALRQVYLARDLDPFSLVVNTNVGWVLHYARKYDEAIAEHTRTLLLDPEYPQTRMRLASVLLAAGRLPEAKEQATLLAARGGVSSWLLRFQAELHARLGQRDSAEALLRELLDLGTRQYVPPNLIAEVYLALGDLESSLTYIERTEQERINVVSYFGVEPAYDPLRDDPRFQALLARAGLD